MNKKVKGAVIFTSGLISGITIGSALVAKRVFEDDDFRHVICEKISNKVMDILYGEENTTRYKYASYRKDVNKNDYILQEVVFIGRSSAEDTLNNMKQCITQYGFVSVSDYYDLSGITGKYTDAKFGWVNIKNVEIKRTKNGYIIDLPQPIRID